MDQALLKQYRQRWQAVATIERQEQQAASIALRWQQLNAIFQLAGEVGLSPSAGQDKEIVWQRWAKLREARL